MRMMPLLTQVPVRFCLASALLVCALLMPPVALEQPVHRYVVSFDISQSMDVVDTTVDGVPASRLSFARQATRELIAGLPCGSEVGFSVFAGRRSALLLVPVDVCAHYGGLLTSLAVIDGRMRFDNASSIGKAMHQSLKATAELDKQTALVVLSDGHEAPPLGARESRMPRSENNEVNGLIAGVGGDTPVRIPKSDAQGRQIGFWQAAEVRQRSDLPAGQSQEERSSLHEPHLRELSQLSGLNYGRLSGSGDLLDQLLNADMPRQEAAVATDLSWVPIVLALLLVCWRYLACGSHRMSQARNHLATSS